MFTRSTTIGNTLETLWDAAKYWKNCGNQTIAVDKPMALLSSGEEVVRLDE